MHKNYNTNLSNYYLLIVVISVSLTMLALEVKLGDTLEFDQFILSWFATWQNPMWDSFFNVITLLGSFYLWAPAVLILLLFLYFSHQYLYTLKVGITFFCSSITTYFLKHLISRDRPELTSTLDSIAPNLSFPSGHATHITSIALIIGLYLHQKNYQKSRLINLFLILLVFMVISSRLYLQVHYPTDVIAGMMVALGWTCLVQLMRYIE